MVLNKPHGSPCRAARHDPAYRRNVASLAEGDRRPVLVHRLDATRRACCWSPRTRPPPNWARPFAPAGAKIYWALVEGVPKPRKDGFRSIWQGFGHGDERVPRKPGAGRFET